MKSFANLMIILLLITIFACSSNSSDNKNYFDETFISKDSVFKVTPFLYYNNNELSTGIKLKRLKANDDQYFPSSEKLIVIINDAKGNQILNTSEGKSFLTVISEVTPARVGEVDTYEFNYPDFTSLTEKDTLFISLILPIKPNSISFKKEVVLK